jgi:lipopolysaccharide assembly protein A
MQFLKILFWCLSAFVAALFTYGNWNSVPIQLWNNQILYVNLPLLLLVAFLAGMVPTLLYQHAIRWRMRQRLAATERMAYAPPPAPAPIPAEPAP